MNLGIVLARERNYECDFIFSYVEFLVLSMFLSIYFKMSSLSKCTYQTRL